MKKFQDLRFGRVVLVGCVLPQTFDWMSIRKGRTSAFNEVRNEIGMSDPVLRLLRWVGFLVPDLGTSGLSGFAGDLTVVHGVSQPRGPCPTCAQTKRRPLVHDVFLAKYRHNDWALGPGHVRELWLPYLWGLSPREFDEFLVCCRDAAYARQEHFWQDLDVAEKRLEQQRWSWTRKQPIKAYIGEELDEKIRRSEPDVATALLSERLLIIDEAFHFTYLAIAEAYEESADIESELTDERAKVILALYPKRGIAKALQQATEKRTLS